MGRSYRSDEPTLRALNLRRASIPDFHDYLVFYAFDDDTVEVLHVLHARLDVERRLRRR